MYSEKFSFFLLHTFFLFSGAFFFSILTEQRQAAACAPPVENVITKKAG